ncbi:RsmB/NOP family class I SAM-dependent RNA methyltransferase [Thetidibacter halocola]|uniref:RsmB/NOP family class I SAM-dependent RNA methyltransferase n=1 Tax=Thetidibacter halocola TaxID=2827239 RepID=A0A8J7WCE8_9RHOB|nr:RsmB/NOP family class I SAM-dependent RNA methyltransferase [Thetidibacter halocola]MBS0122649.1 RsmB/NOP family class I SAM-dependent RNA methyltransferase [Thetidibacter halocola]
MTPGARIQAAIEILDRIAAGDAAERALTNWARASRFAGSKDRAAVRDHVFDVLRRWRSTAAQGGAETGRGRMLGLLRQQETDPDTLFTGEGHAPAPLSVEERAGGIEPQGASALDLPDWLFDRLAASLDDPRAVAEALRHRAPVFLRVNLLRGGRDAARAALAAEGIETQVSALSGTALRVVEGARRLSGSRAYAEGLVELQDAASQAVVDALPLGPGMRVLDYCAGGGGKALAMAARTLAPVEAHDADPRRMADLPQRALRAEADIRIVASPASGYDLVLCDVPCSGSGAWRRAPEAKWRLTPVDLTRLMAVQAEILDTCAALVAPGGALAYATCSVLRDENGAQVDGFLDRVTGWSVDNDRQFLPSDEGDGLYVAVLRRET